jgi:hypothetical protein
VPGTTKPVSTTIALTTVPDVSTTLSAGTTILTMPYVSTSYPLSVSTSIPPEEHEIGEKTQETLPDPSGGENETDLNESSYLDDWERYIASMRKEPDPTENKIVIPALIAFIVVMGLLAVFLWSYYNKKNRHSGLIKQCEESIQKIDSLKGLKASIMHEYHVRMVSEADARKTVLDCEKDIFFEKEKLHRLLRKVGIKPDALQGKEEIIGWIMQKLSQGVDPQLLKKGLIDMGSDPSLVDDVLNALK